VYLQQFWKTVHKVPDTEDIILFKLDNQEIIYTVDMSHDSLQLPVETIENPFVAPVNIEIIKSFIYTVGYQGVVDKWDFMNYVFKKKGVIQYPRFTKLIITDVMKKYPSIPQILDENYHSIKDDILLEIRATDDYKEYEMVFVNVDVLINQSQLVVSTQGMHRSTPRAYRTPTLTTKNSQGKKRKQSAGETSSLRQSLKVTIRQKKQTTTLIPPPIQEKLADEEIEKMVKGEEDEESYASMFVNSMLNDDDDDDDSSTKIEPGSHKENLEVVDDDDDDVNVIEKKDDEKNDEGVEKIDKIREVLDHCNNVVSKMTFAKTNDMIKEEMPRLVNLAVNNDREIVPTNIPELISKEFVTHGPKMIEEIF
nr:hypothetical protein [Tanacetum cinerariifolium]